MKKIPLFLWIPVLCIILMTGAASAVPIEINYQGYLTDSGGNPVTGTTNITFKLYAAINLIDPTWSETMSVNVLNGVYSVVLGATPANPIDPSLFSGTPAFSIAVEGEDMPRQKLTSVAFAIRAASAEKADSVADGGITNVMITGPISATKIEQGPGSNLNADTVDGKQATDFVLRSGDTMSGTLNLPSDGLAAGSNQLVLASGSVGIGTTTPTAKLDVVTAPVSSYGSWLPYDAYYNPCMHCIDTCDGNHQTEYTCRVSGAFACEDIRNDNGEDWEYRTVNCNQVQTASQFTGNVRVMNGIFTGNGSGLTNVTASNIGISCPNGEILQKTVSGWQCGALCRNGDFVNCYEGPSGTLGVGACTAGTRTCSGGNYGSCAGQTLQSTEVCNSLDDDCNGNVDDALPGAAGCTQFYPDADGDSYGDMNASGICLCNPPAGYVSNNTDCRDNNANVHPGAGWHTTAIPGSSPVSWDYDCDGYQTKRWQDADSNGCGVYMLNCSGEGWVAAVPPACGITASYYACGTYPNSCYADPVQRTQECR